MGKIIKYIIWAVALFFLLRLLLYKKPIDIEVLKAKYTDEYSHWMDIDGLDVHYKDEGEGQPVVLIHGTGACLQTFDEWTDTLKKYYRVIRMDIPAFGLTGPTPEQDYSIAAYVNFIHQFAERLNLDRFILGGNSLGGEIAWKYAYYHPNRVKGLLLLNPAGPPIREYDMPLLSAFTLARIPIISNLFSGMDSKILVKKTLAQAYEKDELITPEKIQMYYDMSLREGNRGAFVQRIQQVKNDPVLQPSEVNVPTLMIWGAEDEVLPIKQLEGFNEMPQMKTIVYEGVGHTPQDEAAVKSVHDAMSFIEEL